MFTATSRHLAITAFAALMVAVAASPAAAAVPGPPGGATPVGSPVYVTHANGQVDELQLFSGQAIYPNTPGANLWYLPQDGATWIEVECCMPVDIAPKILAAENADGGIDAFVQAPGGVSANPWLVHAHQAGPGGSWQLGIVGPVMVNGFGGGGALTIGAVRLRVPSADSETIAEIMDTGMANGPGPRSCHPVHGPAGVTWPK